MTRAQWFLMSALLSTPVAGQGSESESELFDLSFEQLLDVQVELATKTIETRQSAPSSITVFTRQEISHLGVSNAYQLMNYVPGLQSTRGDWVGAVPKAHARGVYLDNGNLLVMINGERLNEVSFGKASVYTPFIPVDVIERVEFIRGPGSALYGSNAFIGVMNVVTRKTSGEWMAGVGDNGLVQLGASWDNGPDEALQLHANVAVNKHNGQTYSEAGDAKDPLESVFLELGGQWKDLSLSARYDKTRMDEFINLYDYSPQNRYRSENMTFSGHYQWFDDKDGRLSSTLRYSHHEIRSAGVIFTLEPGREDDFLNGPYWQTSELNFTSDFQRPVLEKGLLNMGVELSRNRHDKAGVVSSYFNPDSGLVEIDPAYLQHPLIALEHYTGFSSLEKTLDAYAVYAQLKYPVADHLMLFAGARYDDVDKIDNRLSPRLSLVYDISHGETNNTVKLQYGEAFRTPVTNELYSNDDVTRGNPNLKPEVVKTTELVWQYRAKKLSTELVLFHNSLNGFINLVPAPGTSASFTFANEIDKQIRGVEMSVNAKPGESLDLGMTYTQLFDDPLNESFKRFASVKLGYRINDWHINVNMLARDKVKAIADNGLVFEQPNYMVWGANLSWELGEGKRLELKGENLFNKRYRVFDPRIDERGVPGFGRQISVQYHDRF